MTRAVHMRPNAIHHFGLYAPYILFTGVMNRHRYVGRMKLIDDVILITGGTSGIGRELATQLLARGNTIIVTGRDREKLDRLTREQPRIHTVQSDAADAKSIVTLYARVKGEFPALNVLINNAGIMRKINLHDRELALDDISREIDTNLTALVRMTAQFLPLLQAQPRAAIVNVSSGLAFTPFPPSPIYGATKAGVHSFTQSLRVQLKNTNIKVFELAPPYTRTPLQDAFDAADVKGAPVMEVDKMVRQALKGMERDQWEILPGMSKVLRFMSRVAPGFMVKALSGSVDSMLAQTKLLPAHRPQKS
jgi:uncharacterized oxidoreductase